MDRTMEGTDMGRADMGAAGTGEITAAAVAIGDRRAVAHAGALAARYRGLEGADLLRPLIEREFKGRVAVVSSFGTEAAVLLSLVAAIDASIPVIFLDTGRHFGKTLAYRDALADRLGLEDVRSTMPEPDDVAHIDPDGMLFSESPAACCHLRKVIPLRRALSGFEAWITGRKRFQGDTRQNLSPIEPADGRIKINPLAGWSRERIDEAFTALDLPRHPLEAEGYPSIGCMSCTARVTPGADSRSGRWAGSGRTECGIHLGIPSRVNMGC
jgi:phosphoadenosine phosphosulfate reductase